ncbi:response regulator [Stieleria sp. TO1_6]|uniref:HD domain-containing phosphohydrolase n=1 Tax=Stieleria tagensis TaxID=2956795 RepID=UPI00209B5A67|nr:HD domain-containing phosphohydrolase [Stieleria tagensis]MCO8121160.1 response regulator [Stieleria tagensis]
MSSPLPPIIAPLLGGLSQTGDVPVPAQRRPLVTEEHIAQPDSVVKKSVPAGKIMIVDDEIANVKIAQKLLRQAGHQDFETTTDSTVAVNMVHVRNPDLLLLDINMPNVDGISILSQLRSTDRFRHLPVLILTANQHPDVKLRCLELGATDFLVKPIDPMELAPRVRNALQSKLYHDQLIRHAAELEKVVRQRTLELERSRREVIHCLARAAELRDNDTGNHVIRVGRYAGIIARKLGLSKPFVRDLELAAQLHDVGKIAVPDAILMKPGKLDAREYEIIQQHVKFGHQIIRPYSARESDQQRDAPSGSNRSHSEDSSLMRLAASIAQTHHEKFDGSGYPIGLCGTEIPIEGRITAVADVYDALSTDRPYKRALPREKCFETMQQGRGTHFDPRILDAFFAAAAEITRVQIEFFDYR